MNLFKELKQIQLETLEFAEELQIEQAENRELVNQITRGR